MENNNPTLITIQTSVHASIEKVWRYWTDPIYITQWNAASDDWHTPRTENDLRTGGTFSSRMEAKDGSAGFDFQGTYTDVVPHQRIAYTMEDGRKVDVLFMQDGDRVNIVETFDPETTNPVEMQRAGWQAILDRFTSYTENN